jgi:hypothetical protein
VEQESGVEVVEQMWSRRNARRVKIRLEMFARDMLPESINIGYERAGLPVRAETNEDIWMFREVDWPALPREGEEVDVGVAYTDPVIVKRVHWRSDGLPAVWLEDFDTDQVGDESKAIESLLGAGWQIEVE